MPLTGSSIQIENPDFPLLGKIDLTPSEITDSITGNSITFQKLCYLPIGLASLEAPPNEHTLHIQDTLQITNASGNKTLYNVNGINNSNSGLNDFSIQKSGTYDVNIILNSSNGKINIGNTASTGTKMVIDVSHNYISQYSGKMARNVLITAVNSYLEPYANFYSTEYNVRLHNVSVYLNPLNNNGDGWFCYLFNYSNNDINVTSEDGKQFVCHSTGGGFSSTQTIKKYATVRLTLVYLPTTTTTTTATAPPPPPPPIPGYVWSVLMY
jgi:hypothetical protein